MTLFVYWCTAWSIGIWLSSSLAFPSYVWAVGAMGTLFPIALIRSPKARLSLSCVLLVALGAIRYNLAEPHFDDRSLVNYNGARDVTLVGVVSAEPDVRDEHIFYKLNSSFP